MQQVASSSRQNNILDHWYTTITISSLCFPRTPLGRSSHVMLLLIPEYRQKLKTIKAKTGTVKSWSEDAIETLRGCFECSDWDLVLSASGNNTNELTDAVTSYICVCEKLFVNDKTVTIFSNGKPRSTNEIQLLCRNMNAACLKGKKDQCKSAKFEHSSAMRKAKSAYSRKLEQQSQTRYSREVWKNLQKMTDSKKMSCSNLR